MYSLLHKKMDNYLKHRVRDTCQWTIITEITNPKDVDTPLIDLVQARPQPRLIGGFYAVGGQVFTGE